MAKTATKRTSGGARRPVGIGLIGLGFMGLTHLRAIRAARGARLAAIATTDPRKAQGDFSSVGGNFGAKGGREDLSGVHIHGTLEELIADDSVDLVDICLPSYLHPEAALKCLRGGKPALVEKPVALRPQDAQRMIDAAKKTGQLLLVAQVLKFFPEFSLLIDAVADQRWGKLRALNLRRIIAMPQWSGDSWFSDPKKSGGMIVDLHIHDTDFIVNLLGKPRSVQSSGIADAAGIHFVRTSYDYGRGKPLVTSEGGWINAPGLPFEHGYDAWFENATLHFNSSNAPQPKLWTTAGKKPRQLKLRPVDGFRAEIEAAVASVRSGAVHPLLSAASAATSLAVCHAEAKSVRGGKRVAVP